MIKLNYPNFWQQKSLINYLLLPLSGIYWILGRIRQSIYTPISFPAKVICIGNITVGGTGKTQLVKLLAEYFTAKNISFVILARSYNSKLDKAVLVNSAMDADDVGDEALELSEYGTVIATRHYTDGLGIIDKMSPEIILVDDGMQNPRFIKDLTLITIDSMRGVGNGMLIPAGPLRQTMTSAKYDAVVMIGNKDSVFKTTTPLFHASITAREQVTAKNKNIRYFAFAAIGNPEKFFLTLQQAGYDIARKQSFPDHHHYSITEIRELLDYAIKHDLQLITTKKDIVKLRDYTKQIIALDVNLTIDKSFFDFIEAQI